MRIAMLEWKRGIFYIKWALECTIYIIQYHIESDEDALN